MNINSRLWFILDRIEQAATNPADAKMIERENELKRLLTDKQWNVLKAQALQRLATDVWEEENMCDGHGHFADEQAVEIGDQRYVSRGSLDADLCWTRESILHSQQRRGEASDKKRDEEIWWLRRRASELRAASPRKQPRILGGDVVKYDRELVCDYDADGRVHQVGYSDVPVVRLPDGTLFELWNDAAHERLVTLLDKPDQTANGEGKQPGTSQMGPEKHL